MSRNFSIYVAKMYNESMYRKPYEFAQKTAKKLKYLRKLHGYSQQQVADMLYMKQTTYSAYERGCIVINGTFAVRIAEIYDVSVSYILDDGNENISISKVQYDTLIKTRDVINEIEKAYVKTNEVDNKEIEYQIPKTKWKLNTSKK